MSERLASPAGARDVVLVVAVAAFAFVLGAVAAGFGFHSASPGSVSAFSPSAPPAALGIIDDRRGTRSGVMPSAADPNHGLPGNDRPRFAPARIPDPDESIRPDFADERFSGNGAGRRESVILRDPHNRRSFILETASLMHRRGWIGLESRVSRATEGGSGDAVRPAAQRAPR